MVSDRWEHVPALSHRRPRQLAPTRSARSQALTATLGHAERGELYSRRRPFVQPRRAVSASTARDPTGPPPRSDRRGQSTCACRRRRAALRAGWRLPSGGDRTCAPQVVAAVAASRQRCRSHRDRSPQRRPRYEVLRREHRSFRSAGPIATVWRWGSRGIKGASGSDGRLGHGRVRRAWLPAPPPPAARSAPASVGLATTQPTMMTAPPGERSAPTPRRAPSCPLPSERSRSHHDDGAPGSRPRRAAKTRRTIESRPLPPYRRRQRTPRTTPALPPGIASRPDHSCGQHRQPERSPRRFTRHPTWRRSRFAP